MSVYKRGNKYWIAFRFNHQRHRKASPDNSYAGAKAYEALIRQKLARGEPIVIVSEKDIAIPTFQEFSKKWFDVYVKTNNKYSETLNKESVLRAHLNPFFGVKLLDKINSFDVEGYKAKKLQAGQSCKSVNNHLIVLNKCLRTAQDWEVIKEVPKIKLLKVAPQKFDFLSTEECQLLLDSCEGILKEMVLLGLKTGLRFGELIALKWSDIDLRRKMATIQQSIARGRLGSTKSNKIRYVPLLEDVVEILRAKGSGDGLVFSNANNSPLTAVTCLRWLHRACERANMRAIGWHTLRHTFASHLAQKGASIVIIKDLMGHADVKTTMRYSHLTASAVRGTLETLNEDNGHNMATLLATERPKPVALIAGRAKILGKAQ